MGADNVFWRKGMKLADGIKKAGNEQARIAGS